MFISVWTNGKYLWPNASIRSSTDLQIVSDSKLNEMCLSWDQGKLKRTCKYLHNFQFMVETNNCSTQSQVYEKLSSSFDFWRFLAQNPIFGETFREDHLIQISKDGIVMLAGMDSRAHMIWAWLDVWSRAELAHQFFPHWLRQPSQLASCPSRGKWRFGRRERD